MTFPSTFPAGPPTGPPTQPVVIGPPTGEAPSVMPRAGYAAPPNTLLTGRTVIGIVLLFLAGVSAVLGVSAAHTRSQLLSSDTWEATSTAVATDPVVQDAVASAIATQILDSAGVKDAIDNALPGPLGMLSGPLTNGAHTLVQSAVVQVVRTDVFVAAWRAAVRTAHDEFVRALEGEGRFTAIGDQGLYLDLGAVLADVQRALVDRGVGIADSIDLSAVHVDILLIDAPGLDSVRTMVAALKVAAIVFPVLAVVFAVAGLVIARRRWLTLVAAGAGVLLGVATVLVIEAFGRQRAIDALVGGVLGRGASAAVVSHVFVSLRPLMLTAAVVGVLLAVLGGSITVVLNRRGASATQPAPPAI